MGRAAARATCLCLTQATKISALELGGIVGSKSITRYIHLHIDFPQTILHSKSLIFLREDLLILLLYMDFPITILLLLVWTFDIYAVCGISDVYFLRDSLYNIYSGIP
jgi:hypothetical protein